MNYRTISAAAAAVAAVTFAPGIYAAVITVDFNIVSTNESGSYPVGTVGSGSFSFDDSAYAPGSTTFDYANGLPTIALSFSWVGLNWTEANARIGELTFDLDHNLSAWNIGATAFGAFCGPAEAYGCVGFDDNSGPDFLLFGTNAHTTQGIAVSAGVVPNVTSGYGGTWTVRSGDPVGVPEPGTLALLALGLIGTAIAVRRRPA